MLSASRMRSTRQIHALRIISGISCVGPKKTRDHAATRFRWDLFVIGGDQASGRDLTGRPLDENNLFACPDGLWFDADGRLWIQTDISDCALNKGHTSRSETTQCYAQIH